MKQVWLLIILGRFQPCFNLARFILSRISKGQIIQFSSHLTFHLLFLAYFFKIDGNFCCLLIVNKVIIQILQFKQQQYSFEMDNVTEWQHPFVDVFKKYDTFDAPKSFKGSVNIYHDPVIARKAFNLTGSILSNNTVTIPDPNGEMKYCNLIGRYLYIEFFASPEKYFCIHFQIGIRDRQPGVRFTFTNMEKQYTISGGNTLKIPFRIESRNLWTVACIDIEHHLQNFGLFSKGAIKNYSGVHILRGVQVCSNLSIRGIYTSSNVYDWNSLPKEMAFKIVKGGRWEDNYNFNYYPEGIDPAEVRRKLKELEVVPPKEFPSSIVQREEQSTHKKKKSQQMSSIIESNRIIGELASESFLQLTTAFSFSSLHNPDLIFKNDKIYYSAGSILVRRDVNTGEQIFMQGHTDYIVAMDSYEDWMVTVQEGAKSSVRIWIDHKCICSFQCPYEKVQQIRLNSKKHLAMVGLDPSKRQTILIFDISDIEISRKPVLLAKQISDFNILTIKFSPVEADKLVSCGKQNIRFWRIKNQHLPGSPVVLNHHARNTIFTVLDFQYSFDDPNPLKQRSEIKKVYVGTQNGLLFQINYATHELEEVYKLHENSAISSLVISSGFCVTGGEDQLLRVWQMDFSEFILEANNDGVVTSLTLSEDASQVACGTSTGVLSILDLTNNNYRTIVRSHTENVKQIVYHQYANNILSLSSDLTIRLWDPEKLQQTYEFSYPSNDNCLCLSPNPQGLFFAAGFQSGVLRIFDIQNTCVIEEIKHHQNPIIHIEYSADGRYLAVLQQKLNMLYSPLHSHQPIKHLPNELPSKYKHSCFSEDSETIAIIGDSGTHINLWQLRSLQLIGKIFTGKIIKKLKYEGDRIWAIFEDTSIRRYNTSKMTIEVEMQALHRNRLNAIDFELNSHLLFSVGDDSFVKVWDYSFLREPHQVFIGHAKNINDILYHNGRLWTAGTQGILVWNFKDQGEKFIEPPIFVKQKKAPFIKNVQQAHSLLQENNKINESRSNVNEGEDHLMIETIKERIHDETLNQNRIVFSNLIKKTFQGDVNTKFVPTKLQSTFQPKNVNFKKTKKREGKPKLTVTIPEQNIQNNLPAKHFFKEKLQESQLPYTRKIEEIKQHNKKFKLEYFIGIESAAHDHVVWNFMYGWYAYIYDNLIIIESLNKARSQRIITMPEKLASLTLTKDYKKLICSSQYNSNRKPKAELGDSGSGSELSDSSSVVEEQQNSTANIYILAGDFSIERKLEFHPRGIQSLKLSDNGKFIVTIGNFRQCTVCVWDFQFGKLKASSYTLQKLNDVSILKTAGQGKFLQFATVGRDQIHFWSYTKDEKLEYYDLFIKPEEEEEQIPELTSCDYLSYQDRNYLFFGTNKGELGIVSLQDYRVTWRKKICSSQLLVIKCCINYTLIGAQDGNLYIWNHNTNLLQTDPTPSFNKINLYYSVNGIFADQQGHEGVISTSEAIYYVNIKENFHSLLAGSPVSPVIFTKTFSNFLLTSHQNGRLKLWNLDTAEELKTYKWKNPCTEAYFDEQIGKLVCFCSNQMVKLVNLKKFTKEENYLPEDVKIDAKTDDYVLNSSMVTFGGRPTRWNFYTKGNVFSFDISLQGKKKSIKSQKVLQLGYKVKEVVVNPEKNLIIAVSFNGTISCYNVDYAEEHENSYSLLLVDKSVADEFILDKKSVQPAGNQERYIKVALSKVLNETYLAINQESQCIYFRNYMKRITFQRLTLPSFPTSIALTENKKESQILVGLKQGAFLKINTLQPESRLKYQGIVNNSIDTILTIKSKNWIVLGHPSSIAIYSRDT